MRGASSRLVILEAVEREESFTRPFMSRSHALLFSREKTHKPFHIYNEVKDDSFSTGLHCFCEEVERVVAISRTEKAK